MDVREEARLRALIAKYDIKRGSQMRFITELFRLISQGKTPTLAEVSRSIGCADAYGSHLIYKKPNVAKCVNEIFEPDLNLMYQRIQDIVSLKAIDEHVVMEGQGDGVTKAVIVRSAPSAQTVTNCVNGFMKIQKDFEFKMASLKAKNQNNSDLAENNEEVVDINDATLQALKNMNVPGFDDEEEEQEDDTDSNSEDANS